MEVSIASIDRHSIAGVISTHDPKNDRAAKRFKFQNETLSTISVLAAVKVVKDFVDAGRDIAPFENVIKIMEIIGRRPVDSIWGGSIDNIKSLSEIHCGIQSLQKGLIGCFHVT